MKLRDLKLLLGLCGCGARGCTKRARHRCKVIDSDGVETGETILLCPLHAQLYLAKCFHIGLMKGLKEWDNVKEAESEQLTPDTLADLLMEERIRGELKQDVTYSKDIVDDVRCKLTVEIIDHRPSYCGAELKEVWRKKE